MADTDWTIEAGANVARGGGAPAPDHDADNQSRASRVAAEQRRIVNWARENGKLAVSRRLPPFFAEGGEHRVYFRRRGARYLKATRSDRHRGYGIALGSLVHGATPSEYLDRLALQNQIFDDDIRLEWISLDAKHPILITSQPAIQGIPPLQDAVDELMLGKGYEKLTDGAYHDRDHGLLIFDLFPRNAILAADGNIYPIDPVIQRVTPDFAQFLREHPDSIDRR